MKQRIAIDMDDVMADTHSKFIQLYLAGEMPRYTLEELKEKSFHELFDEDEYRALSQRVYEPGFFSDIPVMEGAQDVIADLMTKYDVFIASAAQEFPNSLREKWDWLQTHFPAISWRNYIFMGDKSVLNTDYLIDDLPRNLRTFQGEGLLFDALHNREDTQFRRMKSWQDIADMLL
ncbi:MULTISPECIES: 5' nucleotidase, NT5C type [Spirosoma]|uniref:5'(3')-deoxyribonucleotidase n=1 Tax=Spirosoma sordidisoli TaxID=2502893 RepID=A0A4Q2ULK9_9BACT|nr:MULTISPECIES: 5'(3')-deoxyribonucleotidase [Spirosoma]RYC70433.1 5'(3')-deoxyribonucleotidase [Spirosoma sordidisoli]